MKIEESKSQGWSFKPSAASSKKDIIFWFHVEHENKQDSLFTTFYLPFARRVTTKTSSSSSSTAATSAKTSGRNVSRITASSAARPYKVFRDERRAFYRVAAHFGECSSSVALSFMASNTVILHFYRQQIQRQDSEANYRVCSRQLRKASDVPKVSNSRFYFSQPATERE